MEQKPRSGGRERMNTPVYGSPGKTKEEKIIITPDENHKIKKFLNEQQGKEPLKDNGKISPEMNDRHTTLAQQEGAIDRAMAEIRQATDEKQNKKMELNTTDAFEPENSEPTVTQKKPKNNFFHRIKKGLATLLTIGAFSSGMKGPDYSVPEPDAKPKTPEIKKSAEKTEADSIIKIAPEKEILARQEEKAVEKTPKITPKEPEPLEPEKNTLQTVTAQKKSEKIEGVGAESEPEIKYTFTSGDGFYDAAHTLQDNFKVKSLYSKHPEWKKLSKKKALERWRVEQGVANGHGVSWYENIPMPGAELTLTFDTDSYPTLKLIMDKKVTSLEQRVERQWPAKEKAVAKEKEGFFKKLFRL